MILGTLLGAVASILSLLLNLYILVIVVDTLLSWVRPDPYSPIVQVLHRLTNPVYAKIRSMFPTNIKGIDFAPLILAVFLKFIDLSIVRIISRYADSMTI